MISFTNKNIMVVVAHQDDETLFAGGFLTNICENCSIMLICMSKAKYKNQISIRNDEFKRVSELLHAEAITTNFKDSKWISYSVSNFFNKEKTYISPIFFYWECI